MRAFQFLVLLLASLALLAPAPSRAQSAETPEETDRRLTQELRAENPAAADTFILANSLRAGGRHQEAGALYGRVTELAPRFSHAWRRQGYELLEVGRKQDAIRCMRTALSLERSAWNLQGLAAALVIGAGGNRPPRQDLLEAGLCIGQAEGLAPEEPGIAFVACQVALYSDDFVRLGTESARLERLAPGNPMGSYFHALQLAMTGDLGGANDRLERARKQGLPDELYIGFKNQLDKARFPLRRPATIGGYVLFGWVVGILVLLVVGSLLSRLVLRAARRVPGVESGRATGGDAMLRRTYRWVLWVICAYYYASIPLLIGVVLAVGGGLIYLMLLAGHIPVKLFLVVIVLTLVTLWAIVRSIFVRGRDEDPGLRMQPGENPRLRALLDGVAARVGTRTATNVYFTPGTEIAVMERGGVLKQLRGEAERCLILGIGALEGMRIRPFRAILAHEYGHFSNRDTAGGGFALAVRRSLLITAFNLARGGAAGWFNPAWLFVNGFYRLFLLVSQGASRLQEVLADRWAAFCYGAASFRDGLRHVIERSIRFEAHANAVLSEAVQAGKPLVNLYSARPATGAAEEPRLAEAVEAAIHREPSEFDSHPSPVDRIAWVEGLGATGGPAAPDDGEEVWSLFEDREALERRLTEEVRRNLAGEEAPAPSGEGTAAPQGEGKS